MGIYYSVLNRLYLLIRHSSNYIVKNKREMIMKEHLSRSTSESPCTIMTDDTTIKELEFKELPRNLDSIFRERKGHRIRSYPSFRRCQDNGEESKNADEDGPP